MFRSFDIHGDFEIPQLILCNPNGKELHPMSHALHIKPILRIGGYSEISFKVPKETNDVKVKYYDLIQKLRLVKVEDYGVFVIDTISETFDGVQTCKEVSCKTIDALFATKSLISIEGTYKLYDITGQEESMMSMILSKSPDWKIGEFDADLMNLYRTYNISEQNLYDLMMNDLSEDFQCVFKFDTFNKLIHIKTTKNAMPKTDIFTGFENLLKDLKIDTVSDSIKTSLEVYGADNLSIHDVNPLGGSIYNFNYFKTTDWMSQSTIDALNTWENKVRTNQVTFANNLTKIKDLNHRIIGFNIELVDLQGELKALENVLSAQVTQGISTSDTNYKISLKNNEITNKNNQIVQSKAELKAYTDANSAIQTNLKLEYNFNSSQLDEIRAISNTTGGIYINDSFVKTSTMSSVEVQEEAQRLYDLALTVLEKESQPRYTFTANIVNFLALEWAETYSNQLELGCQFTVAIDDTTFFYPVLLEYGLDFDDLTNCTMTFCNDLRLSNQQFDFASLFDGVKSTVSSVSTSKGLWEDYIKSGDKDSVFNLKNDALDLATKDIMSNVGQSFLIDQTGIRGRKLLSNGSLSSNQLWITNNSICMTTNNWQTSSLALGEITFNGIKKYGLATEVLVGNLIVGESMIIKNQNNSVIIDGQGFTATNLNVTLNASSGNSQILLNANDAIRIKSKVNGVFQDTFYVDTNGNLNFKGNLTGATGTFSGTINGASFRGGSININNRFIVDEGGNCTATSMKISSGSFESGVITGTKITGTVIEGGTISGTTISGATINGGSINISTDARLGQILYLQSDSSNCGIKFGNGVKIEGNYDGLHVYGALSCDRELVCSGNIYSNFQKVATESWCNNNLVTESRVSSIVRSEFYNMQYVKNVVWNENSRLLKIYFGDGSSESYTIADKIGEK